MTEQQFLNKLEEAIGLDAGTLAPEVVLEELDSWDSMAVLEFQAMADEELELILEPTAISACDTVADLVKLLGPGLAG